MRAASDLVSHHPVAPIFMPRVPCFGMSFAHKAEKFLKRPLGFYRFGGRFYFPVVLVMAGTVAKETVAMFTIGTGPRNIVIGFVVYCHF
jgi:hypothetical protein